MLAGGPIFVNPPEATSGESEPHRPFSGTDGPLQDLSAKVDELWAESGYLPASSSAADSSNYLHTLASARWLPASTPEWEAQVSLRADGYYQTGTTDLSELKADYGPSFLRYNGQLVRITAGAQTVIWGRTDEIPPTDRLGVHDLRRYILDELPERRLAVPALRIEGFHGPLKLDALWVPFFREAELPDEDSIWHPVDQSRGRLIGIDPSAAFSALIRAGTIGDDVDGGPGLGLRLSGTGSALDYGLTVQRTNHSLPYYELDPAVRAALFSGADIPTALASGSGPTLREVHPRTWVFSGDLGLEAGNSTWRLEAAYLSDLPVTTVDFRLDTVEGLDWVAGVETYPGDGDLRINLQLSGHHFLGGPATLDRDDVYTFNGEIEQPFAHDRWRAGLRFSFGLDERDHYLNPQIKYLGLEPHEFYLAAQLFSGAEDTFNGFHEDHDQISLGWRARF